MNSPASNHQMQPMSEPYRFKWHELREFREDQMNKVMALTERFGRVVYASMLGIPIYFISEPKVIREFLVRHANDTHKDRFTTHMFKRILGESVLTVEDETWRRQRKLIQPIFHARHIDDFANVFASQAKEMCDKWQVGKTYQLDQEMMGLTLRIICQTMFSADVVGMVNKVDELLRVIVGEAQFQLKFGLTLPNWMPFPSYWRQNRALKGIEELLLDIIRKRQTQIEQGKDVPQDLLTMLLTAQYDDGQAMSEEQVLHECITIFFAGHETTAVSLTWVWAELLQHPEILEKLQTEVNDVLNGRPATYQDVDKIPYLSQVLKESLRLHPPAAAVAREVMEPFDVDGIHFKKGETITIHINTLHHQAAFYPEPGRFNPERFAPDQEQPDRYTYMPFGAGPRICVGNAFAMLEMQMVLATMIQSLDLSLVSGQEIVPEQLITLRPKNGVQVKVESRTI